jgi:hypothetical protein
MSREAKKISCGTLMMGWRAGDVRKVMLPLYQINQAIAKLKTI